MSLSDPVQPYPVVHHFYPIDPATSSQQSFAVQNSPSSPVVAPIRPFTFPHSRGPKTNSRKRRNEDEMEVESLIVNSPTPHSKRGQSSELSDVTPISLTRIPGTKVYVEIPVLESFDRSLYKPLSPLLHTFDYLCRTRESTSPSLTSLRSSSSDHSYHPSEDDASSHRSKARAKKRKVDKVPKPKSRPVQTPREYVVDEDEADGSTCHQCRRKTKEIKMRCRNIRTSGFVCTLFFCERCLRLRYGETFDDEHRSWHCPRCRGICNCSICLRKAGHGYILDNGGDLLSRKRGRLFTAKRSRAKQLQHLSVREWLARRGILLGTDEWMAERRHMGIRYFIGMRPPPSDKPLPYQEARLNLTLAACQDEHETSDNDEPLDPRRISESGSGSSVELPSLATEDGIDSAGPSSPTTQAESWNRHSASVNSVAASTTSVNPTREATPEATSPHRSARLIVGKALHRSRMKRSAAPARRRCFVPKSKATMYKANEQEPDSNDDLDMFAGRKSSTGLKIRLPPIRVRKPDAVWSVNGKIKAKDEHLRGESSAGNAREFMGSDDEVPIPPRPSEPVLVPTEHYTPSKLDLTYVKDLDSRFPQPFWAPDIMEIEAADPRAEVFLSYAAPDAEPPSLSLTQSMVLTQANSSPTSHTASDVIAGDAGYAAASWVPSSATFEETWITNGGLVSGLDMDMMPPVQMEHLVNVE